MEVYLVPFEFNLRLQSIVNVHDISCRNRNRNRLRRRNRVHSCITHTWNTCTFTVHDWCTIDGNVTNKQWLTLALQDW